MLDVKRIRQNFDEVKKDVERRGKGDFGMEDVRKYDTERRELLAEVEQLKNRQNTASREVPKLKKAGEDTTALFKELKELSQRIKELDGKVSEAEENLHNALLGVPTFRTASTIPTTWRFGSGVNRPSFPSSQKHTGTLVRTWTSWTSTGRRSFPVPDSRSTRAWVLGWSAH